MLGRWLGETLRKHHSFAVVLLLLVGHPFQAWCLLYMSKFIYKAMKLSRSCVAGQSWSLAAKHRPARAAPNAAVTAHGSCRTAAGHRDSGVPAAPCMQCITLSADSQQTSCRSRLTRQVFAKMCQHQHLLIAAKRRRRQYRR